jgi:hypothetical protein
MVEWPLRKPNWVCGMVDTLFMKGEIRFNTNFSQILAKRGRRLIGRYEEEVSGGLPGFKIKIIIKVFHCRGK